MKKQIILLTFWFLEGTFDEQAYLFLVVCSLEAHFDEKATDVLDMLICWKQMLMQEQMISLIC